MAEALLPDTPYVVTQIGADVVMGLWYWPATRVGFISKAEKPNWTQAQRLAWIEAAGGECPKCGVRLTLENTHIDHIFPRSEGGQNWGVNLRALCSSCNIAKGANIESITLEGQRGTMLGDLAADGYTVATGLINELTYRSLKKTIERAKVNIATFTVILISHKVALLIVGGVVLVVSGRYAVKWLLEHADGERRYVRLARSLRESISHLAHHAGRLARHLEVATEHACRVQSGMGGLARQASGVAGHIGDVAVSARDASSAHAPTIAHHASRMAHDAGRVSGQVARTAGSIAGDAGRVSARRVGSMTGQVPVRVGNVAGTVGGVVRGFGQAHGVAEGAFGRVSLGRFGRRATDKMSLGTGIRNMDVVT